MNNIVLPLLYLNYSGQHNIKSSPSPSCKKSPRHCRRLRCCSRAHRYLLEVQLHLSRAVQPVIITLRYSTHSSCRVPTEYINT